MAIPIPKTCKAIVLDAPGAKFELREVPVASPKKGEILIKTLACGVCHSDASLREGEFNFMAKFPVIPGHEVIGTVIAVGEGAEKWKIGDRAGGPWHGGHDGTCRSCNRCMFQMCENELVNGVSRDGGLAEYCTLRSEAAVRVPDDVDPADYAPLLCAGVTTFNGIRKMKILQGDTVAICGVGGLGHLAIQYAHKMGYNTVAISEHEEKRELATKLGAQRFINTSNEDPVEALNKIGGANAVLMTAPNPEFVGKIAQGIAPGGTLILIAPVPTATFEFIPLVIKGVSIHGWSSGYAFETEEAIKFAMNKSVNCMVEKYPIEKFDYAMERMLQCKSRFRTVITF
ncbi:alcohol dehydrogenase, partial [Aureobasidium melanogenum]|uniref:Alcohol dehydrogenase n=1 Tax=Aureobasidium melanogenum (strain CBS 110374) TaxID=1043003 RepID=A0A074W0J6_AURM1